MLKNDKLRLISLALCWFYTKGVIASNIKPDILEGLDQIPGLDLTEEDMKKYHIWPQGVIPYYIDDFSFDKVLRDRIRSYIDHINKITGLHFTEVPQPPKGDKDRWVLFINRKGQLGCADVAYNNFTNEGVQRVVLGYDCLRSEELDEIILSLVGVPPQHNSPDRDDYITVNLKNILPDKHYLFEKLQPQEWSFGELKYDISSAGHYSPHKHTSNGVEAISPKNRENYMEGGKGLSATDVRKIRMLYNYISMKDKEPINIPECSKLFVPGMNFSQYVPTTKYNIKLEKVRFVEDEIDNDNHESKEQFKSSKIHKMSFGHNKSLNSEEETFLLLKHRETENIKNPKTQRLKSFDHKPLNSEEKTFLLFKQREIEKMKTPETKQLKGVGKILLNDEEKNFLLIKQRETDKIKNPKTQKLKSFVHKSVNSDEKTFLLVKQRETGKIKSPETKKIKSFGKNPLNKEEKNFLLFKQRETDKIKNPKTQKLKSFVHKSVNSDEKTFLLVKQRETGKMKSPETKKMKSLGKNPLNKEEKNFLLFKQRETDKIETPKTQKLKSFVHKSVNSDEKTFLLVKERETGKINTPETQNMKSVGKNPLKNDENNFFLKYHDHNKFERGTLDRSDYETSSNNEKVDYHFK